jgi:LPXTG-motif cell wall-anchored protein
VGGSGSGSGSGATIAVAAGAPVAAIIVGGGYLWTRRRGFGRL